MTYKLTFEISPELYKRAVTQPIEGAPSRRNLGLRNGAALSLASFSVALLTLTFGEVEHLFAMIIGAALGAALVLAVWWKQHRTLVRLHGIYNETGGLNEMSLGPDLIIAKRPNIESRIAWPFVRAVRQIEGATLIELPTARLIIPDTALPERVTQDAFAKQLDTWRAA